MGIIILLALILCAQYPPGTKQKQVFYEGPTVQSNLLRIYELQSALDFSLDMYFLDKGALIIGFADKRPLIQRALL